MNFSGSYVALVTPFTDNGEKVDYTRLEELIEMQIAGGTAGITPAGCTGEAATLSHAEQGQVIRMRSRRRSSSSRLKRSRGAAR